MAKIRKATPLSVDSICLADQRTGSRDLSDRGYRTADGSVVVRPLSDGIWELVWGRGSLQDHDRSRPVLAWIVECGPEAAGCLQDADQSSALPWHALAAPCTFLRALKLPNQVVAPLLRVTPAEVSRLTRFGESGPELRRAVSEGLLSPGHARRLALLPRGKQPHWTAKAIGHRWSVRQLDVALADDRAGVLRRESPDTASFLSRLGEVLGTQAVLEGGQLRLACYSVEEAKGLMERLAQGPEVSQPAGSAPAWLCVPAADNDQLYALTGHLISD